MASLGPVHCITTHGRPPWETKTKEKREEKWNNRCRHVHIPPLTCLHKLSDNPENSRDGHLKNTEHWDGARRQSEKGNSLYALLIVYHFTVSM